MSDKTGISWTDATWNPTTGCTKVSRGCKNCYAKHQAWPRLKASKGTLYYGREFEDVQCHPERLDQPIRWTKPRRIFVNSMSDLFHEAVPFEFIDRVWAVMCLAPHHQYQVLTKRPERMREYLLDRKQYARVLKVCDQEFRAARPKLLSVGVSDPWRGAADWIWLGVSVEDQFTADERIPLLLETPAAVRWVSYEPALAYVNFDPYLGTECIHEEGYIEPDTGALICHACEDSARLDWIVIGGESGPGARPFEVHWARVTVMACKFAMVPVFVKQLGAFISDRNDRGFEAETETFVDSDEWTDREAWPYLPEIDHAPFGCEERYQGATIRVQLRDRKGGDMDEWPLDLRVREYPECR